MKAHRNALGRRLLAANADCRRRAAAALLALALLSGCRATPWARPAAPEAPRHYTFTSGQLIVHSNFYLPPDDPVIRNLTDQRETLRHWFGLPIADRPIDVFLFQDAFEYQDFVRRVYPDAPSRRACFIDDGKRLAVYAQWGLHSEEDLRHEVAHGYVHSCVPHIPIWLDEGIAEYCEVLPDQHRINRPLLDTLLRARREQTWTPSLRRLDRLPANHRLEQLEYAESWAWVHFLMETRSEYRQAMRDYLQEVRRDAATPPLSLRLRGISGNPEEELLSHLARLAALDR